MNIHEYQAKNVLKRFGISVPNGKIAYTPKEALAVAAEVSNRGPWMLKAQIQSGARQSGFFLEKSAGSAGFSPNVRVRRCILAEGPLP